MSIPATLISAFAPTGKVRAAINLGNPILAGRDAAGAPCGVSVDLAREFAARLGCDLELVVVDAAGKSVDMKASGFVAEALQRHGIEGAAVAPGGALD